MYKKIYSSMIFLCILTLLLSVTLILTVFYTTFDRTIEADLKNDTLTLCTILNNSDDVLTALKNVNTDTEDLRLTLIANDGNVIYDSDGNDKNFVLHTDRPEFSEAKKNGIGQAKRFSQSLSKRYYYCAAKLNDGTILRSAKTSSSVMSLFYASFVFILLMLIVIFLLSSLIASQLTVGILKPITNPSDATADQYDEIRPFTQKIVSQNREIKRQIEKVSHQEHQHQLIVDNMNEALIVVDKSGCILSMNNYAAKIFNVNKFDVKKRDFHFLTDNELLNKTVQEALLSRQSDVLVEMGELSYRVFCSPFIKNNVTTGVVILMFDVTSTAQSEKLRREFSANVSHELKTPLTSINGYAQLIASSIAKSDDIPVFAARIAKESNRLMLLIDDIIRLSRLDENSFADEKLSFSLKEAVLEVMSSLTEKAAARNISVTYEGSDFFVTANKSQIEELLYNISENAIKYNKDGGSVSFVFSENTLRISDTGIGISSEFSERIFERFFRVDKSHSKKVDGTGLGLSIAKHIAKINDIDIKVKSILGKGTDFVLIFH